MIKWEKSKTGWAKYCWGIDPVAYGPIRPARGFLGEYLYDGEYDFQPKDFVLEVIDNRTRLFVFDGPGVSDGKYGHMVSGLGGPHDGFRRILRCNVPGVWAWPDEIDSIIRVAKDFLPEQMPKRLIGPLSVFSTKDLLAEIERRKAS